MENTGESVEKSTKEKMNFFKDKKKMIIVITAIVLVLAIILAVFLLTRNKVKFKGESNGIKYSAKMQDNTKVLVVMKNETGKTVSNLELVVSYYNEEGKEVDKQTTVSDVYLKNGEISLNDVIASNKSREQITDFKVEVNPKYYEGDDKLSKYEKIELSEPKENKDEVLVNVKNTKEASEYICVYIVFYKNGLPVAFQAKDLYDFQGEKEISYSKPTDDSGNKIKYDFCKAYIKY